MRLRRIDSGNIVIDVGVMLRYLLYLLMTGKALVGYGPKPVRQLRVRETPRPTRGGTERERSCSLSELWGHPTEKVPREAVLCERLSVYRHSRGCRTGTCT